MAALYEEDIEEDQQTFDEREDNYVNESRGMLSRIITQNKNNVRLMLPRTILSHQRTQNFTFRSPHSQQQPPPPPPRSSYSEEARNPSITPSEEGIDDECLVDFVKRYPIIWATSGRGYKDIVKKNQAWNEIANTLQKDGKVIFFKNYSKRSII